MNPIRFARLLVLGMTLLAAACSKAPDAPSDNFCTPGETSECSCGLGLDGTQTCDDSGYFGDCACETPDGGVSSRCVPGAEKACTCVNGAAGTQSCNADKVYDACVCVVESPDVAPCTTPETEVCDGKDNDCDGVADEGLVCPIETVAFTDTFTQSVYFQGTLKEGSAGYEAIQRFWPSQLESYLTGFDQHASTYGFRSTDGALFYYADGIHRDAVMGNDPLVATPPCDNEVYWEFGFDGTGTIYYRCDNAIYMGNGKLVAQPVISLLTVLDDGRVLVVREMEATKWYIAVLDGNGDELSRLDPREIFPDDSVGFLYQSASAQGKKAYVGVDRWPPSGGAHEIVAYRLDGSNRWAQMRRVSVEKLGKSQLILSDGTIMVRGEEQPSLEEIIQAYLPDNSVVPAWREAEAKTVRAHIGDQMLVGPR